MLEGEKSACCEGAIKIEGTASQINLDRTGRAYEVRKRKRAERVLSTRSAKYQIHRTNLHVGIFL